MERRKHWRLVRLLAGSCALAVALVLAPALSSTAHADRVYGYKISRFEVIARAHYWLRENVQYSQSAYHPDPEGTGPSSSGYRTDCSGFISMAWHLNQSRWTGNLADVATQISKSSLKPGDMLLNQSGGHVVLFEYWSDKSAGKFRMIQQSNPTNDMLNGYGNINSGTYGSSNYKAYRYNKIFDTGYSAGNETGKRSESGAQCRSTTRSNIYGWGSNYAFPTIDLPNRRDIYIKVRSCIKRESLEHSSTTGIYRYRVWITVEWEPGRDSDDSSNTSKKPFDSFRVFTQVQSGHNTKREVVCYLHNNFYPTGGPPNYNGARSCSTSYNGSTGVNWQVDGFIQWAEDGDGKRFEQPLYVYGRSWA